MLFFALPVLVDPPAANGSGNYYSQDQNRHEWEAEPLWHAIRVQRGVLLRDDAGVGSSLASGLLVFGNRLLLVEPDTFRISADVRAVEDAAGKLLELLVFQRLQVAAADLGGGDDLVEGDAAHLPLAPQVFAERTHTLSGCFGHWPNDSTEQCAIGNGRSDHERFWL